VPNLIYRSVAPRAPSLSIETTISAGRPNGPRSTREAATVGEQHHQHNDNNAVRERGSRRSPRALIWRRCWHGKKWTKFRLQRWPILESQITWRPKSKVIGLWTHLWTSNLPCAASNNLFQNGRESDGQIPRSLGFGPTYELPISLVLLPITYFEWQKIWQTNSEVIGHWIYLWTSNQIIAVPEIRWSVCQPNSRSLGIRHNFELPIPSDKTKIIFVWISKISKKTISPTSNSFRAPNLRGVMITTISPQIFIRSCPPRVPSDWWLRSKV